MKVISDRVSILSKDNLVSVVILSNTSKQKLIGLFLWLFAWTVCGLIVFINYFKTTDQNAKLFIIVYLSFWAYFEYKIAKVFMWRRNGKEKIWLKEGFLNLQKEINGRGKVTEYEVSLINDFKEIELSNTSWADNINQSFWVKGGERLSFEHQGKVVLFGMQLTENEAFEIYKALKKHLT